MRGIRRAPGRQGLALAFAVNKPRRWIHSLSGDDYTVGSLARKLTALRVFARHLVREKIRGDDFTALLIGPKLVRRLPGTLSAEEVARLLAAPTTAATPSRSAIAHCSSCFIRAGCGSRSSRGSCSSSSIWKAGFCACSASGSKERVVPVGGRAREALTAWLTAGRPRFVKPRTGSQFFLNNRGGALSRVMLWMLVKKYAQRAGITKNVKPHLLRHSFATHLLTGGADPCARSRKMLGHANIATTQIYTAVESKRLIDHHAKFHPRNKA